MEQLAQDIVDRFKSGDCEAFRCIIEHYQQRLYRLGLRLFTNQHDAADFVQDVLVRVYEKRSYYDSGRAFEPWLFRVAVNFGRSRLRQRKWKELLLGELPEVAVAPNAETALIKEEHLRRLSRAMNQLHPQYRACLSLRFDSELSLEEIADTLKLPLGTVKSQLSRGLKKLIEGYQASEGGLPCVAEDAVN